VGNDLMIVTPRQIFLTGFLNNERPVHLVLIAGNGVALATHDLEEFIQTRKPDPETIAAACQWVVHAVVYKPGAGWYGTWGQAAASDTPLLPLGSNTGQRVSLTIRGATLEGNLQRWIDHVGPEGLKIEWDPTAGDLLPFTPVSINLLRIRSAPGS